MHEVLEKLVNQTKQNVQPITSRSNGRGEGSSLIELSSRLDTAVNASINAVSLMIDLNEAPNDVSTSAELEFKNQLFRNGIKEINDSLKESIQIATVRLYFYLILFLLNFCVCMCVLKQKYNNIKYHIMKIHNSKKKKNTHNTQGSSTQRSQIKPGKSGRKGKS